jgi:dGTPase
MVADVVRSGVSSGIRMNPEIMEATNVLRNYLFECVYPRPEIQDSIDRAKKILREIYRVLVENPGVFLNQAQQENPENNVERLVVDFVAGMTDRYALDFHKNHFPPESES